VRRSAWRLRRRLPARGAKRDKDCPDHDGDIGNVEHTGPKRPNADVEEVHDAAAENSINPVRCAARNEQDETNTGGASEPRAAAARTSHRRAFPTFRILPREVPQMPGIGND